MGSPCGACKFLRRKCVKGCVFAPYFCHEQGATHFAAIHKVFGASNVSKLLAHLPVSDRCEAAVTISYEAQARLQDPIYGCVSHIFSLQQQVVNLQAQLASLREQAAHCIINSSNNSENPNDQKFSTGSHCFPQLDVQSWWLSFQNQGTVTPPFDANFHQNIENINQAFHLNGSMNLNPSVKYENPGLQEENSSLNSMDSLDHQMQSNNRHWPFQDEDDFQSVAFRYIQHEY
ncbi:LOB domain-containing protein 29 [Dorcoceras hygrometricum]|uniref:LOB domain-containing protein 29 n=1 Tax=Dorcoceras hygrometricum TaxID=472368 RepID=A0A2Z7AQJ1_9LAMI|nr:LOB domain-containing protein 29 [Dorcoceras hygrometricum]